MVLGEPVIKIKGKGKLNVSKGKRIFGICCGRLIGYEIGCLGKGNAVLDIYLKHP